MYLVKTPWWLRKLCSPSLIWKIPTSAKEIFLTFDDGPHPAITPFVLHCLKKYDAKATFFCLGKNAKRYPEVYRQILQEGHTVGNHTFDHLNGWKTGDAIYLQNVAMAKQHIDSTLFRPPYGRISRSQVKEISSTYKIIMWDVLSGDFDVNLPAEKCLKNVTSNITAGSVVVFHDSEKAFGRLEYALPKALEWFTKKGIVMKAMEGSDGCDNRAVG